MRPSRTSWPTTPLCRRSSRTGAIGWRARKPGAFARYRYREDLYPSITFRRAYDALVRTHGERADVEYLRILHLAATAGEARVVEVLATLLDQVSGFDYVAVQAQVA